MDAVTRRTLRLVSGDYPEDDRDERPRRRAQNPSVGGRVAIAAAIAVLTLCCGTAGYLVIRSGVLDPVISPLASETLAEAAPQTHEAAATTASTTAPVPAAQIAAVDPPGATAAPPTAPAPVTAPIPDTPGLVVLIRNAITGLDQANVTGDYSVLWAMAAPEFQQRNSPASLSEAFANLRGSNLDLGAVNAVNPSLYRPPTIDAQGYLHLTGFVPMGTQPVDFDLAYKTDAQRWRLFGIALHPQKAPDGAAKPATADAAGKVPQPARLVALIRGTVLGLNQANLTGDYSVFREGAAAGFQAQNDLPHLATQFAPMRQRGLDLSPVAVIAPALAKPASVDKKGFLHLLGYFPSRPEQVSFELVYGFERGRWRLFGIGLETSALGGNGERPAPSQ